MSLDKVYKILEDNNIPKESILGKKLIKKYKDELKNKKIVLESLEKQINELAESDFLEHLKI